MPRENPEKTEGEEGGEEGTEGKFWHFLFFPRFFKEVLAKTIKNQLQEVP